MKSLAGLSWGLGVLLIACGPSDPVTSDGSESAATAESGSEAGGGTGGDGTTSGGGTGADGTTSGDSDGTTSGDGDGTTSGDGDGTSSGDGDGTTTGDGDGTTVECVTDADCKMFEDCCSCTSVPTSEDPAACELPCLVPLCQSNSISETECRFGSCTIVKHNCDPNAAVCGQPPPACPVGMRPDVVNGCWSGACRPEWLCNQVTDCSHCLFDEICYDVGGWTPNFQCHPRPQACGDTDPDCACGSGPCDEMNYQCSDGGGPGGAGLTCYCPNC